MLPRPGLPPEARPQRVLRLEIGAQAVVQTVRLSPRVFDQFEDSQGLVPPKWKGGTEDSRELVPP